jgi:hypothetical protein
VAQVGVVSGMGRKSRSHLVIYKPIQDRAIPRLLEHSALLAGPMT